MTISKQNLGSPSSEEDYKKWAITEARGHLAELIQLAMTRPQIIEDKKSTEQNRSVAVISLSELHELQVLRREKLQNFQRNLKSKFAELKAQVRNAVDEEGSGDFILSRNEDRALPDFRGEG